MPFKSKTIRQLILMLSISIFSNTVFADRIKDFTDVAGQRPNQLVGYGLVVGLDGMALVTKPRKPRLLYKAYCR